MLDSDLAEFYGVTTGNFNKSVKRNIRRFPKEFMFQLTSEEYETLIFQNGISKNGRGGRRKPPYAFTDYGIAMLSGVLKSERAIKVNISIIKTFIQMRKTLTQDDELRERMNRLEDGSFQAFKLVFKKLENLEGDPGLPKLRRKIGIKK